MDKSTLVTIKNIIEALSSICLAVEELKKELRRLEKRIVKLEIPDADK